MYLEYRDAVSGNVVELKKQIQIPRLANNNVTTLPTRIRNMDVAAQILRLKGQRIVNACADHRNNNGLQELEEEILQEHLQEHPVGKFLLQDIRRLQTLFHEDVLLHTNTLHTDVGLAQPRLAHCPSLLPPTSLNRYSTACASAGSRNHLGYRPESFTPLRRQISDECTQYSLPPPFLSTPKS